MPQSGSLPRMPPIGAQDQTATASSLTGDRSSTVTPATGPVAVGLHTNEGRLMGCLLAGIAEGMLKGFGQPNTEGIQR